MAEDSPSPSPAPAPVMLPPILKKYYAKFDERGLPIGFYLTEIKGTIIPEGAIEITKDQWRQFLAGEATGNYKRFVNGAIVSYTHPPRSLTPQECKAAAISSGLYVSSDSDAIEPVIVSLSPQQISNFGNVALYAQINNAFPGGQDTFPLQAVDGSYIQVPTVSLWNQIAKAAADYVALCEVALVAALQPNGVWVAPNNEATIA